MALYPELAAGVRAIETKERVHLKCESLSAFVAQASLQPSRFWPDRANPDSRSSAQADWKGSSSFEEAVQLATYGWREGRERMVESTLDLKDYTTTSGAVLSEDRDVYGFRPDVPLFCTGAPACMVVPGDRMGPPQPFVNLMVCPAVSSGISTTTISNWGAALVTLVDATEAQRRRVAISVVFAISGWGDVPDIVVELVVKKHSDPLDIDGLCFAIAHPSMLRRFILAIIEQGQSQAWVKAYQGSYGAPTTVEGQANQIIVPSPQHWKGMQKWDTPMNAYLSMEEALQKDLEGYIPDEDEMGEAA